MYNVDNVALGAEVPQTPYGALTESRQFLPMPFHILKFHILNTIHVYIECISRPSQCLVSTSVGHRCSICRIAKAFGYDRIKTRRKVRPIPAAQLNSQQR